MFIMFIMHVFSQGVSLEGGEGKDLLLYLVGVIGPFSFICQKIL